MDYVHQTAVEKVRDVYNKEINNTEKGEPALVIAADTIVVSHFGMIMEKPRSVQQHLEMLKTLRDQGAHKVYTAVAVMAPLESAEDPGYRLESHIEETTVRFDPSGGYSGLADVDANEDSD
jgi:septum formation protein